MNNQNKANADSLRAMLDARREAMTSELIRNNPALKVMSGLAGETVVRKLLTRRITGTNKYTPHQGKNEKFRRAMKIAKSHPNDCHCATCEYVMVQSGTQD